MTEQTFNLSQPIIIFGNGEAPNHPIALKVLKKASTIISLDGGSDKLISMGYSPDYIVGDMDSLNYDQIKYKTQVILMKDQSKNDLEKFFPARVKWFNKSKGFGFANIFRLNDDIFLHIETLRASGLSDLETGEAIVISISEGPRGKMANTILTWDHQSLVDVKENEYDKED